jgi:Zn-dependent protease with chaperone function
VLVGVLGLAAAVFSITRLFVSWRITHGAAAHELSVFGQTLSYPAANAGAILVTVLASLGLLMAGATVSGVARELLADRRFRRALAARSPRLLHGAWLIEDHAPQAFCAGLLQPRVYFSSGMLEALDGPALAAVLAHERHHARRRDPLRLASARVLGAALFWIPARRQLLRRQLALAEMSADEAAVRSAGGDRSGLASAMLSLSEMSTEVTRGVDPARIDYLAGERTPWHLPVGLCVGAAAALALFMSFALAAAQVASGSATLAPPFLSSQPCVVPSAMIPLTAGIAYAGRMRRLRTRKHTGGGRAPLAAEAQFATLQK